MPAVESAVDETQTIDLMNRLFVIIDNWKCVEMRKERREGVGEANLPWRQG